MKLRDNTLKFVFILYWISGEKTRPVKVLRQQRGVEVKTGSRYILDGFERSSADL
jgi:hypothetical protein